MSQAAGITWYDIPQTHHGVRQFRFAEDDLQLDSERVNNET